MVLKMKKSKFVIGRSPECDVELADETVSRKHAILESMADDVWVLRDEGSSYGTHIITSSGVRAIHDGYFVTALDVVRFGDCSMPVSILISAIEEVAVEKDTSALKKHPVSWAKAQKIVRCDCGALKAEASQCKVCRL